MWCPIYNICVGEKINYEKVLDFYYNFFFSLLSNLTVGFFIGKFCKQKQKQPKKNKLRYSHLHLQRSERKHLVEKTR